MGRYHCGYVMKDSGCDHHTMPFICGGCDFAFLTRCLNDYQAVSKWKWRREGALNPDTYMQHLVTFDRKHLTPLDLHPIQVFRIMLVDGFFQLGERWAKPQGETFCTAQHLLFLHDSLDLD
jgi:hypothetical protein